MDDAVKMLQPAFVQYMTQVRSYLTNHPTSLPVLEEIVEKLISRNEIGADAREHVRDWWSEDMIGKYLCAPYTTV